MQELSEVFKIINNLIDNCNIDYLELKGKNIDESFFKSFLNQRLLNSFLYNFIKIQDKIGTKLFKKILFELKEIDNLAIPMKDTLNILAKLEVIDDPNDWDTLREIRNILTHEYPLNIQERIENVELSYKGFEIIKKIYNNLIVYCSKNGLIIQNKEKIGVTDNDTDNDTDNRLSKIIYFIERNNKISTKELSDLLAISQITIKRDLKKLKELNSIKRVGSEKSGHWEVINIDK